MNYTCPVCGYKYLEEPPFIDGHIPSHDICDCCGAEYGYDCFPDNIEKYRQKWVSGGCRWFNPKSMPLDWSMEEQLKNIR